jgi:hypothetical protein
MVNDTLRFFNTALPYGEGCVIVINNTRECSDLRLAAGLCIAALTQYSARLAFRPHSLCISRIHLLDTTAADTTTTVTAMTAAATSILTLTLRPLYCHYDYCHNHDEADDTRRHPSPSTGIWTGGRECVSESVSTPNPSLVGSIVATIEVQVMGNWSVC